MKRISLALKEIKAKFTVGVWSLWLFIRVPLFSHGPSEWVVRNGPLPKTEHVILYWRNARR